jgi:hypothetical protein
MYEPSGAMAGSWSPQVPENEAICGFDHSPWARCETRIIEPTSKYTVFPSGVNAGQASPAGPEMTPGEKISGSALAADAANVAPRQDRQAATSSKRASRLMGYHSEGSGTLYPPVAVGPHVQEVTGGEGGDAPVHTGLVAIIVV